MSTSASGFAVGYISVVCYPIKFWINILLVSIIYMLFMLRSHKHIYDVTNLLIIAIFGLNLLSAILDDVLT